jgi:predicted nucleic acid-binding protein
MENRRILIDTSVVIDYLRSSERKNTLFVRLFNKYDLCLSVISVFELYNGATNINKKQEIQILCDELIIVDLNFETAKLASEIFLDLRKKNKIIEFRDILIGATSIHLDIMIATLNKKHFNRIENIIIFE